MKVYILLGHPDSESFNGQTTTTEQTVRKLKAKKLAKKFGNLLVILYSCND